MYLLRRLLVATVLAVGLTVAGLGGMTFISPASAHTTPDQAADTPFAGEAGLENGLPHYLDALSHSEGENALVRNPTCGAHNGPDGIHPPAP